MSSDTDRDPHRRESPAGHILKTESDEATVQATRKQKTAEGTPGQGIPRHFDNRVQFNDVQSHKSIRRLTGSPRLDSREQIYTAWDGQDHE